MGGGADALEPDHLWALLALSIADFAEGESVFTRLFMLVELSALRPCMELRGLSVFVLVPGILLRIEFLIERVDSFVSERENEA